MRNYFTLDGVDSRDFGIYISGQGTFGAPRKAYTYHSVPGRSGDLIGSEKRFENLELHYPAFIYANFRQNISDLRNFLLSREGYVRLEDTYNPDEFRLASYTGEFAPEVTKRNDAGSFDLVFNCMFPARPLIRVYGYGTLYVGGLTVVISDYTAEEASYIDIDCSTMQAYNGDKLLSKYVSVYKVTNAGYDTRDYTVDYPTLVPGTTHISKSSVQTYISSWEITPRWWKL